MPAPRSPRVSRVFQSAAAARPRHASSLSCLSLVRRPAASTLFPYTTLFRSLTSRLSLSKHLAHNLGNLLLLGKIGVFHNRRNAGFRDYAPKDRKSGSAGMPRPISYAVFCLKKKIIRQIRPVGTGLTRAGGMRTGFAP